MCTLTAPISGVANMGKWPSGWISALLESCDIPITPHSIRVTSLWNISTPTDPWTNNPLGAPASESGHPAALNTKYALFPTTHAFRAYMKTIMGPHSNSAVRESLTLDESLAKSWRAISSLAWPASETETDWPSALLDSIEDEYKDGLNASTREQRKTIGTITPPKTRGGVQSQSMGPLTYAAASIRHTTNALNRFNARGK